MTFKSQVGYLNSRIHWMKPLIPDIEKYCNSLGDPKDEVENFKEIMKEGAALVTKCSTISRWNAFKQYKYSKKLHDLDKRLSMQLTILKEEGVREWKKNLYSLKHIGEKFEKLESYLIVI
ncbi:unnamed protein product [Prunus armeniaca]|uniref:RPW8 domain-containing protein n=1 Tax=Prunus armeniaca TaxID=36596 RepID=A0A6J5UVE1_PRUAR|nr:unnamed protein product [Prunus armeniaca]CAB4308316.1 unnamed protein product [Prunus armeniaca]